MSRDDIASERDRMLAGGPYRPDDPELVAARARARRLMRLFNASTELEIDERRSFLTELFGRIGPRFEIEPPFFCDYGSNIFAGDNLFMNFGCVILDCAKVTIGIHAFIGPGVHIYAAFHPVDPTQRNSGWELAGPVSIGDNCWIGGHAVICPGVRIGDNSTIGAGSVVTRDVPSGVVAAGNPCRIIRQIAARP